VEQSELVQYYREGSMRTYQMADVEIIELIGNIQQEDTDALEHRLYELFENGLRRIVVDMSKVSNVCSSALGILVSYKRSFTEVNGDIKVVIGTPQMKELFKVTMLNKVFDTSEQVNEAVELF